MTTDEQLRQEIESIVNDNISEGDAVTIATEVLALITREKQEARQDGISVYETYFHLYHKYLNTDPIEWQNKFNKLQSITEGCEHCSEIAFSEKLWRTNWASFKSAWEAHTNTITR